MLEEGSDAANAINAAITSLEGQQTVSGKATINEATIENAKIDNANDAVRNSNCEHNSEDNKSRY